VITLWAAALAWGCEAPSTTPQLEAALHEAQEAFVAADLDAFVTATDEAREMVPCIDEVVPGNLVAVLHRTEGLAAFFEEDTERAGRAFAAARRLDPLYRFPSAVVPSGNPLLDVYVAVGLDDGSTTELPPPAEGSLRLDGRRATHRPDELPLLFQRLGGQGRVQTTAYLWPGEPVPEYPAAGPRNALAPPMPTSGRASTGDEPARSSVRTPLRVSAGATAVGAGLLYGAAALVHLQYDLADDADQLGRLRSSNNVLVASSGAALITSAGLLTVSFVVP